MRVVTVILVLAIVVSSLVLLRSPDIPAAPAPAPEISARPTITPVSASGVTVPRRQESRRLVRGTFDDDDRDATVALMFLLSAGSKTR